MSMSINDPAVLRQAVRFAREKETMLNERIAELRKSVDRVVDENHVLREQLACANERMRRASASALEMIKAVLP